MNVKKIISSIYDIKQVWTLPIVFLILIILLSLTEQDSAFIISIGIIFTIATLGSYFLIPFRIERIPDNLILKRIVGDVKTKHKLIKGNITLETTITLNPC